LNPWPIRRAARFLPAAPPQYECTLIFGYFGKRLGAPGLADPGLPGYQYELPSPRERSAKGCTKRFELAPPADYDSARVAIFVSDECTHDLAIIPVACVRGVTRNGDQSMAVSALLTTGRRAAEDPAANRLPIPRKPADQPLQWATTSLSKWPPAGYRPPDSLHLE
jgi:hypothetical protein